MKQKQYEEFNCESALCGKRVVRELKNNGRVGKQKKYCSRECAYTGVDHVIGRSY